MTDYWVLGDYLVSEKIKEDYVTTVYRGIYAPSGKFEKFVFIRQLNDNISGADNLKKEVLSYFKQVSKLSGASIAKTIDVIDDEKGFFTVSEFEDGRFLSDAMEKSVKDGFPFSVDHALLIANKLTAALSFAYSKGIRHGFVTPKSVQISFEGDVKLYDFALSPFLSGLSKANPQLTKKFQAYIHPDVFETGKGGEKYDIFSIGAIIFSLLTGKAFVDNNGLPDIEKKVNEAVLSTSSFGDEPIPDDIKQILIKSLSVDGGYKSIAEFNEDLENLIFSGDYSPTTFNLAFFMHSLYREESEQSAKVLELEKTANYAGYFVASEGQTVTVEKKKPLGLIVGSFVLIVILGAVAWYLYSAKQKTEMEKKKAEELARIEMVKKEKLKKEKELEIARMKKEMDEKLKKLLDEAAKAADEKARAYFQEQARLEKQRQEEEIRKQEEELKRINDEKKKLKQLEKKKQQQQLQKQKELELAKQKAKEDEKRRKEQERLKKLQAEQEREKKKKALYGTVVPLPEVDAEPRNVYKEPIRLSPSWRLRGKVRVNLLVDHNGNVENAIIIKGLPKSSIYASRAEKKIINAVKKYKYTPAVKEGVNVKVWISIVVNVG